MSSSSLEPPRILFEDDHFIAVDKPAGVVVHAGTGHREGVVEQLRAALAKRRHAGRGAERVAPVHRLDRDTSGVLLFGKDEEALRRMARLFESGEVEKQYLVLCKGITHKKGKIDVPLLARPLPGRREEAGRELDFDDEVVDAEPDLEAPGKKKEEALTTYRRLIFVKGLSLLVVRPHTGRTHQIRRHLRSIGHPVAGDPRWGDERFNYFLERHKLDRIFIHAAALTFVHPFTGEAVTLRSTLPPGLMAVLESLGFDRPRPPWGPPLEAASQA